MVAQLRFLKQLSCKPSPTSGEGTRGGGRQIPFGRKEGRSRRRGPERETPRATNQRAGRAGGGSRAGASPGAARAASGLLANRLEPVLCACPLPLRLPAVPRAARDAGGAQPVVRALEPAGGGREAEAPAAGQIRRRGGRRAGQGADAHPGTRARGRRPAPGGLRAVGGDRAEGAALQPACAAAAAGGGRARALRACGYPRRGDSAAGGRARPAGAINPLSRDWAQAGSPLATPGPRGGAGRRPGLDPGWPWLPPRPQSLPHPRAWGL